MEMRKHFGLGPDDNFYFRAVLDKERDIIIIQPVGIHALSQAWFWTKEHQALEEEANADIKEGRVSGPFDIEELMEHLDQVEAGQI